MRSIWRSRRGGHAPPSDLAKFLSSVRVDEAKRRGEAWLEPEFDHRYLSRKSSIYPVIS